MHKDNNNSKRNEKRKKRISDKPIQMRYAEKFALGIKWINEMYNRSNNDEEISERDENMINRMKEKLLSFLQRTPGEFIELVGGDNMEAINNLINDLNLENRIKFLEDKLTQIKELEKSKPNRM